MSSRIAGLVQSLSGFQVRCNMTLSRAQSHGLTSFNPYRVFKFVATLRSFHRVCFIYLSFNPYRVFKFVATSSCVLVTIRTHQFQSLSGFQVRCNLGLEEIRRWDYLGFNPYRVFKFVATSVLDWARYRSSTFQSLSGFQVRCNDHIRIASRKQVVNVSIPIGFSSSLQRKRAPRRNTSMMPFQSLSGFQVRCNQATMVGSLPSLLGFNPYRVFKFVATQGIIW